MLKYSVSQLINYLKIQITNDVKLSNISIQGEIGNFVNHVSGHWYFSLKDENSFINCVMFKYNRNCDFIPKNGDSVIVFGNINIYEKNGQLQIVGQNMQLAGKGNFYAQFEAMKQKLEPLGYFDQNHKKEIPLFNNKIAVVTGNNTAALQDIIQTINSRWPICQIEQYNAIMQGETAANSCIEALLKADKSDCDVIILARGGGSVDDLFCFNNELLATTIYNLNKPIVTGIGHQIDLTICDLVADAYAFTPTAAAIRVTPDILEVRESIISYNRIINNLWNSKFNYYQQLIDTSRLKIDNYSKNINIILDKINNYQNLMKDILINRIGKINDNVQYLNNLLEEKMKYNYMNTKQYFINLVALLDSLSPLKVLDRGYTITKQNNNVIKSINDIDIDSNLQITFKDGTIKANKLERV